MEENKTIKITLKKSLIGKSEKFRAIIKSLGFKRLYQTIEVKDTPAIKGMINKVSHMVTVE